MSENSILKEKGRHKECNSYLDQSHFPFENYNCLKCICLWKIQILENENNLLKEQKIKLEETLAEKDEFINDLKNEISKYLENIKKIVGNNFPNNIEDPGNLNNNLIKINNKSTKNDEFEKNPLQEDKKEENSKLMNNNDPGLCEFNKLTNPQYKVEIQEINWNNIIFDADFIVENKPSTDFYCCEICSNIVISPKKCSECEKLSCAKCIETWLIKTNEKKCTRCRKDFELLEIGFNEKCLLNNMKVKCPFDCGEKFDYEKLELHFKTCTQIKKIYNCELCYESVITNNENQRDLKNHDENCPAITFECTNCFKKLKKNSIEEHRNICRKKFRKCSKCCLNYYERFTEAHDLFYCEKIKSYNDFILNISSKFQLL